MKNVSNLLINIGKVRDLMTKGTQEEVIKKFFLIDKTHSQIKTQVKKYIESASHEIDFNYIDLADLSGEIYDFVKNYQGKFLFSKYEKLVQKLAPIDDAKFLTITNEIGCEMELDTELRRIYKELSYLSLIVYLWSETEEKKELGDQLTDLIRSFVR